jgi:cysteine desulfurase / selenocysteine lyase
MFHYLDYAATSALRPPEVTEAVSEYLVSCGGTPGRGGHQRAVEAGRTALRARRAVLELLGLGGDPGRFVFTHNATHALNLALLGLLAPGDTVVVTDFDHNAVVRPLHHLARTRRIGVRKVPGTAEGELDREAFRAALEGARMVILTAASNVLGTLLPVAELAAEARRAGALVLVDAAQSAGHVLQDLSEADLVAVTGHKALLGPQGTGGLWVRPGVEPEPLLRGGAGGDSLDPEMPHGLPDRLEAGTLNGPGLAGLEAGCRFVSRRGVATEHERLAALKARLREGLCQIGSVRVVSPPAPEGAAIVTLTCAAMPPGDLARALERRYQVQARAGLHCAPGVHRLLGTTDTGALRFSLGWASTEQDVDRALEGVEALVGGVAVPVTRFVPGST